jgi:DNA-binding SARP family transcriptional activator
MNVGVLGPLQIMRDGLAFPFRLAPKPRVVLAVLSTHAGSLVPTSTLIRELWEENPPISALRNIQTYVSQVRKVLSQVTGLSTRIVSESLLMTRAGGYVFSNEKTEFEHALYRDLIAKGHHAVRRRDHERGIAYLKQSLKIWRGPSFADVTTGAVLEAQRLQLEETRIGAVELLSSAEITAGRPHEAIAELASVVHQNPLHEGLHYQYVRALDMVGNRVHALDVFRTLRLNLVTELGIEPSDAIRTLHSTILNSSGLTASQGPDVSRALGTHVGR